MTRLGRPPAIFHFLGLTKDHADDIQPLHLRQHILAVFALFRRIEFGRAIFLRPAKGCFLAVMRVGGEEFRLVGADRLSPWRIVHGMHMNIDHRSALAAGVLREGGGAPASSGPSARPWHKILLASLVS
jgi:hypothetical protein